MQLGQLAERMRAMAHSLSVRFRQLADIGRYAPRLVACGQVRNRSPSGLVETHVGQRLTIVVADDKAAPVVLSISRGDEMRRDVIATVCPRCSSPLPPRVSPPEPPF